MSERSGEPGRPQHDTFLSVGECLRKAAARCRHAAEQLQARLDGVDSPYREGLERMVATEFELAGVLQHYAERGPAKVLSTRLQFNLQLPQVAAAGTVSDALKDLMAVNVVALDSVREQVSNTVAPEVAGELEKVWREAEALGRRISTIHSRIREV